MVLSGSLLSLFGVSMLFFRVPFASYEYVVLSPDLAPLVTVLTVVVFANAINLIDGLDGLAVRDRDHRRRGAVPVLRPAVQGRVPRGLEHRAARRGDHGRGSASASCPTTSTRPASSWVTPARMFLGLLLATTTITIGGRTADPFSGQTYFFFAPARHPAGDPRRPDRRHRVLVPPAGREAPVVRRGRQGAPPPPADAPGPRSAAHRRDPLALDRAALGASCCSRPTPTGATPWCRWAWSRSVCCSTSSSTPGSAAAAPRTPRRTPADAAGDVVELEPRRAARRGR